MRYSANFTVERNTESVKKVCNVGNLANTFAVAASKQILPFLLVDQAERLDTRLMERKNRTE